MEEQSQSELWEGQLEDTLLGQTAEPEEVPVEEPKKEETEE